MDYFGNFFFVNLFLLWLQKYYPHLLRQGKVDHDIANRGLGMRGNYHIPRAVWDKFVPMHLLHTLHTSDQLFDSLRRPLTSATLVLLNKLVEDGFLLPGQTSSN